MIPLTTSLLMLSTAFMPVQAGQTTQASTSQTVSSDHPLSTVSVEAYVRDYYRDTPILAEIARCESTFRQFDSNGDVIRGKVNKGDIGIMQINKYYHEEDAAKLGFDIYTVDGNLGYAKYLYEKYGSDPWSSSSKCWKPSLANIQKVLAEETTRG
ncbi:MAG TPA: hypothetical protein VFT82_04350 [Candidatus Paceibacterota bacterium]|nr:hypothetical protein [Candidatus Paceibacterota bacterium]